MHRPAFSPGSLVRARGRDWVVLPSSTQDLLYLRTLGGSESSPTLLYLPVERALGLEPTPAGFPPPNPERVGNYQEAQLLRDALLLKLRNGAGPFRSFGQIAVEPRPYQLAPLLLALKYPIVRLLIADDVGVGKTIEACLIARELLDRGEVDKLCVLCPPHLCDQWRAELHDHFNLDAQIVRSGSVAALERQFPGKSIFDVFPYTVVSLDYIKIDKRRDDFAQHCPNLVLVDEAHSCVAKGQGRQQRFELLQALAAKQERHLVLLTATPHSGDTTAFYHLLSLLKPEYRQLAAMPAGPSRDSLREDLRNHFIQRGRDDIRDWQEVDFFPKRVSKDGIYQLHPHYARLIDDVCDYAAELLQHGARQRRRLDWWAALALLRCISSSPAAAEQTLINPILAQDLQDSPHYEAQARATTSDGNRDNDDLDDQLPPLWDPHQPQRLRDFAQRAHALCGPQRDHKLACLIGELRQLHAEGFRPIVFCRYLKTAEYLVAHLGPAFPDLSVVEITGNLDPSLRQARIAELDPEHSLLVASDCLSEGINLQTLCNAVVHYDLAWNPNRHEQRIGRVDRFGQSAAEVRSLLIYGEDNPIDGAVLRVIINKARAIQHELGVRVPLPHDARVAENAILQAVLFSRRGQHAQAAFDFFDDEQIEPESLQRQWAEAAENPTSRGGYLFAQNRIKYEEVWPELDKTRAALGDAHDTERFMRTAAARLGVPASCLDSERHCYRFPWDQLPLQSEGLKQRMRYLGLDRLERLCFQFPAPQGFSYVHRAHALCHLLADHLAEQALEDSDGALARNSAIFTREVATVTTLYLLRLRLQLKQHLRRRSKTTLAEEALAFSDDGQQRLLLDPAQTSALLALKPSKNIDSAAQTRVLRQAQQRYQSESLQAFLDQLVGLRSAALEHDHQVVRNSFDRAGQCHVEGYPPDLIGVFVLVPDLTGA